jgi:hypothetical protein
MFLRIAAIFFIAASFIYAQGNRISGKIIDSKTSETVAFASVYLSGTTTGTATDKNGVYRLDNIPTGVYRLVVSMIGYNPAVQEIRFTGDTQEVIRNFVLEPRTIELNQIIITGKPSAEWKKNLELFKKYFLGRTELTDECTIENENDLLLTTDSSGVLHAKCNSPIVVTNHALGYKIECLLIDFYSNEKNKEIRISYAPKFTELAVANKDEMDGWLQKREEQYLSSLHRFFRTLIKNDDIESEYFVNLSGKPDDPHRLDYPARPLDPRFWSEHIIRQESTKTYLLTLGRALYEVQNRLTRERSFFQLPSGETEIDNSGYPVDPFSIHVLGRFSELGLANSVPQSYGIRTQE